MLWEKDDEGSIVLWDKNDNKKYTVATNMLNDAGQELVAGWHVGVQETYHFHAELSYEKTLALPGFVEHEFEIPDGTNETITQAPSLPILTKRLWVKHSIAKDEHLIEDLYFRSLFMTAEDVVLGKRLIKLELWNDTTKAWDKI